MSLVTCTTHKIQCQNSSDTQVGEVGEDWFSIYLIPETLRVTVLGTKQQGDTVNLEIEAQTQVRYHTAVLALVPGLKSHVLGLR